jgi:hypothetical protein
MVSAFIASVVIRTPIEAVFILIAAYSLLFEVQTEEHSN